MFEVKNLRFMGFGPFTFSIKPNECLGLTGPSGAGKTQLLRALCDLYPSEGYMALNGKVAHEMTGPVWRKTVGFLPADNFWWEDLVRPHFSGDPGQQNLEKLGFDADVMTWPISRLSSGERQRLALLRLLVNLPEVLLLDEPTAHLDAKMVEKAEGIIRQYQQDRQVPVLWVSHDQDQLQRLTSVILRLGNKPGLQEVVSWK